MLIFAAAAQSSVNKLIEMAGNSATPSATLELVRTALPKIPKAVSKAGRFIMDLGGKIVTVGWRLVLYGFAAWAGIGLIGTVGIFTKVLGSEVVQGIPSVASSSA